MTYRIEKIKRINTTANRKSLSAQEKVRINSAYALRVFINSVLLCIAVSACDNEHSTPDSTTEDDTELLLPVPGKNDVVVSLSIAPAHPVVMIGDQLQAVASAIYSNGAVENVTGLVTWRSDSDNILSFASKEKSNAIFMALSVGKTGIIATYNDLVSHTQVRVSPRSVEHAGPLAVSQVNPRYFTDGNGKVVYLTGSHTWANLQDSGEVDPPPVFDFSAYLDFLNSHHHNFFRLWTWEQSRWTAEISGDYWFSPMPFTRTGPGVGLDGKAKFDLTRYNQTYFDRMRERIVEAGKRGIYVSVMLFNGWSIEDKGLKLGNPWPGHPFNKANNINGIAGDLDHNGVGIEIHTLENPNVTAIQEAYVKKVIDTVNDLDNVMYEISNESKNISTQWQYHMITVIKQYEANKAKQHPVGMTYAWRYGKNADLFASPADWISPNRNGYLKNPRSASGEKVVLSDTDHLCGICGDGRWVWESFFRGLNPIFMDLYDGSAIGVGAHGHDAGLPVWEDLRKQMGYSLDYARRIDLQAMLPRAELVSTGYCLAKVAETDAEYLVYLPKGKTVSVDLSGSKGTVSVEWFEPQTGRYISLAGVEAGKVRNFNAPFKGQAILYLYQD